jgi:hypothetical protein
MSPRDDRIDPPQLTNKRLGFLMAVPLAWAVLLWFHPGGDGDVIYTSLREEVTTWQIVHVGTLVFIGLMGIALYMLVLDLPGRAATISRLAIGPFVLFYAAWEAVIGLGTGALVQHANDVPPGQRPAVSDAIQSLQDNIIVGDPGVFAIIGVLAWATAVIAAVVAYRRVRAPVMVSVLLGLSVVVVSHPPPIGPIGLACFAGAAGLLAISQRTSRAVATPTPASTPMSGVSNSIGLSN